MSTYIEVALGLFGIAVMVSGLVIQSRALSQYARAGEPKGPTLNPRRWKPVWKCMDRFEDPRGYALYVKGTAFLDIGFDVVLLVLLYRAMFG